MFDWTMHQVCGIHFMLNWTMHQVCGIHFMLNWTMHQVCGIWLSVELKKQYYHIYYLHDISFNVLLKKTKIQYRCTYMVITCTYMVIACTFKVISCTFKVMCQVSLLLELRFLTIFLFSVIPWKQTFCILHVTTITKLFQFHIFEKF